MNPDSSNKQPRHIEGNEWSYERAWPKVVNKKNLEYNNG